ncbi:homoserine dehydrogenase [Microbacterium imperiale]|uniref:NAD-binding homoserine dehydrogenase n=1 Tax=Microbacterium imperiale TaxID=33884 RepID=A0A9W6HHH4_9MICO|nr:homoserine dehydrogenase [Microbacterium imperiale]MBP2420892.1 putative homoserine dehydrogenase-like protein [Microbacterium imperiale]BFE41234.1 NAD-binding homoserine dehydrogenase [Microbacterium imperiale]GLJ80185.1 NAD-binding homoserine dehydrogenase [Microbacterium imperiale]
MIQSPAPRRTAVIRIALTGANGGYGRTLLDQLQRLPDMTAAQLVDPDVDGVVRMLTALGVSEDGFVHAASVAEAAAAVDAGKIAVIGDGAHIAWTHADVLVEATGRIEAGHAYAEAALDSGTHVVMVSKEIESVAGVALSARARERGLRYLPGDGDQPANLLRLVEWVLGVGFDIVALGKSGEYDLVFDPETGIVNQNGVAVSAPALADLLSLGDDLPATLAARAAAVADLKRAAAADSCEMNVVSLYTGAVADIEAMHYPVARPDELADIYAERADGGILASTGVIDVFSMLRLPGEASFAGGVFAIVRTGDDVTWDILRGKGHVVSRNGRYACIYWPYHFMGVETPLTVAAAVDGTAATPEPRQHTVLAARTTADLAADTVFRVEGHHHEISGVAPVIVAPDAGEVAPYYLLSGARLRRDVAAGSLVTLADLEGVPTGALAAYRAGLALGH